MSTDFASALEERAITAEYKLEEVKKTLETYVEKKKTIQHSV
jgi:hypothetical protein